MESSVIILFILDLHPDQFIFRYCISVIPYWKQRVHSVLLPNIPYHNFFHGNSADICVLLFTKAMKSKSLNVLCHLFGINTTTSSFNQVMVDI